MQYHYLYRKFVDPTADLIVHDRTYEGLEVRSGKPKPSITQFKSFQEEENRLRAVEGLPLLAEKSLLEEKQHQAKAIAWEKVRPLEDKIKEIFDGTFEEIRKLREEALEIQNSAKAKEMLMEAWEEISSAQERVNEDARTYLSETDWYVTREKETGIVIPAEVKLARQEARERIQAGETVYAKWRDLREKELPSREEIKRAIQLGGEALAEMRKIVMETNSRYKRPKKRIV